MTETFRGRTEQLYSPTGASSIRVTTTSAYGQLCADDKKYDRRLCLGRRGASGVTRLPGLVAELAALKPRVIVSVGIAPVVPKVAPDLPHVFTAIADDPVRMGLVQSFARPGGNTTGNVMTALGGEDTMAQKRVGLFRELAPNFKRLGFIGTTSVLASTELAALRRVTGHFGFELLHHVIEGPDDIEKAVAATTRDGADALYVSGEPHMYTQMPRVAPLVVASGKPSFGTYPDWARAGLLMSYASDIYDGVRRAGLYVAKILRGEKPGDIPIWCSQAMCTTTSA